MANLRELLEANIGAEAIIHEAGAQYTAVILGEASKADALPAQGRFSSRDILRPRDNMIALKTGEDVHLSDISRIEEVEFKKPPKTSISTMEYHNLYTMHLDWGEGKRRAKTAEVGMYYLQQGICWVPSYRVNIDGHGKAEIKLQATISNGMTDLDHATVNLVVGVPSFEFKDSPDPMSLERAMVQISGNFNNNNNNNGYNNNGYNNNNAVTTQVPAQAPSRAHALPDINPVNLEGAKNEDLFVYTIKDLSLKAGESAEVAVAEFTIPYKDLYSLDLAALPPKDIVEAMPEAQHAQMAQMVNLPNILHQIRLVNESHYPLTTAPAMIFHGGQVIAQGRMRYTPPGCSDDLPLTTAVNLGVRKSEKEINRKLEALTLEDHKYTRIDLAGTVTLINGSSETVEVQVTRHFIGNADQIDHKGVLTKENSLEDEDYLHPSTYPTWWSLCGWPDWWNRLNGLGQASWTVTLEPGKDVNLGYSWYYYWR